MTGEGMEAGGHLPLSPPALCTSLHDCSFVSFLRNCKCSVNLCSELFQSIIKAEEGVVGAPKLQSAEQMCGQPGVLAGS